MAASCEDICGQVNHLDRRVRYGAYAFHETREKSVPPSGRAAVKRPTNLPPSVTFAEAAVLLRELGIDENATADSVRYMARSRGEKWPFGNGPAQVPYRQTANARTMDTKVLLDHLEDWPPNPHGRGRDKKPRARTREPS
jgi:hypothetical protein